MHRVAFAAAVAFGSAAASAAITSGEAAMLATAARVAQDIRAIVPPDYWERARCVVVVPADTATAGGSGRGVVSCRAGDDWSAPVFIQLERGSAGPAKDADLAFLAMTASGVQRLLDAPAELPSGAVAPGPIGRHAEAPLDPARQADLIAYARTQGLFAGVDAAGVVIRPDAAANADAYDEAATPRTILAMRGMSAPTQASAFLTALGARESMVPSPPPAPSAPVAPGAAPSAAPGAGQPSQSAVPAAGSTEPDVRARIVALQQAIDRLIVDAETSTAGTTGGGQAADTVPVSRERLMQLRRQLDAILAAVDKRP